MFFLSTQRIYSSPAPELLKALLLGAIAIIRRSNFPFAVKPFVAVALSLLMLMPTAPALAQSSSATMPPTAPKIVKPSDRTEAAKPPASVVQEQHAQLDSVPQKNAHPSSETGDRIARPGQLPAASGTGKDSDRINRPSDPYRISRPSNTNTHSGTSSSASSSSRSDSSGSKAGLSSLGSSSSKSSSSYSSSCGGLKTAPPIGKGSSGSTATAGGASQPSPADMYPAIGKLEQLTFGTSKPDLQIEERLISLESAVFAKTYPNDSLFDRTERLKTTLLGKAPSAEPPGGMVDDGLGPPEGFVDNPMANNSPDPAELAYLDEIIDNPDNYKKTNRTILDAYALELINYERQRRALGVLQHNHLAQKMADEQIRDLVERGVVSHNNAKGDNPDRRYTLLGGVDAVNETLAILSTADLNTSHLCKAAVAKLLKQLLMQQDDREALLAPEATHVGYAIEPMNQGAQIISCIEVLTNRGIIHPVPKTARVGDKIEVEGTVDRPYVFDRITLAWEGVSDLPPQEENSTEPLPYFPPLDFVAYKQKSEKDHSKAIFALKTAGMLAAIAGGMFVPPVALAAPLIMMAGPDPGEVKPVSDVPVKGGVKVSGDSFSSKVTVSNDSKEGLYYLTVWANMGADDKAVAISRRTILVKNVHDEEDVEGKLSIPKDEKSDTSSDGSAKSKDSDSKPADSSNKPVGMKEKPGDSSSTPVSSTPSSPSASSFGASGSAASSSAASSSAASSSAASGSGLSSSPAAEKPSSPGLQARPAELKPASTEPFEIGKPGDPFAPEKSETEESKVSSSDGELDAQAEIPTSRQSRYSHSSDDKSDDSSDERD